MTRCITVFFGLAFMLQLCACGSSDLDDEGRVSISLLGDGEVEVIGDDIYCTDDCEHLVKFSSAETNSTLNNNSTSNNHQGHVTSSIYSPNLSLFTISS